MARRVTSATTCATWCSSPRGINYGFSPSNKQEIENACCAWLKEKFYSWNLRAVYLAGHTQGGLAGAAGRRGGAELISFSRYPHTPP